MNQKYILILLLSLTTATLRCSDPASEKVAKVENITLFDTTANTRIPKTLFASIISHLTDPITGIASDKEKRYDRGCAMYTTPYGRSGPDADVTFSFEKLTISGFLNKERGVAPDETDYILQVQSPDAFGYDELHRLLQHAQKELNSFS